MFEVRLHVCVDINVRADQTVLNVPLERPAGHGQLCSIMNCADDSTKNAFGHQDAIKRNSNKGCAKDAQCLDRLGL